MTMLFLKIDFALCLLFEGERLYSSALRRSRWAHGLSATSSRAVRFAAPNHQRRRVQNRVAHRGLMQSSEFPSGLCTYL